MLNRVIRTLKVLTLAVAALVIAADSATAQAGMEPVNDLPNPYQSTDGHLRMPIGRDWGAVSAIELDPDGKSIWVAERLWFGLAQSALHTHELCRLGTTRCPQVQLRRGDGKELRRWIVRNTPRHAH